MKFMKVRNMHAQYGDLQRLYDASSDEFFIEEINDAYEEFKRSLYD
ncbi:hypothetical protein [Acinetobacter baumannii]|nr:hypothetical protein [Acinetobacter baumannii]